ncbi:menaquinone biosynthesis decarboxylase [soil metagenome]
MYRNVGEFVAALEAAGELTRVRARVSAVLEISKAADAESKTAAPRPGDASTRVSDPRFFERGGKALLFENVEGSDFPVLINALGSYRRMEMALGIDERGRKPGGLAGLAERIGSLTKPALPRSLGEMAAKVREFLPLLRIGPKRRRGRGECQQVVLEGEAIDLRRLPLIRCWPMDGDYAAVGYPAGVNEGIEGLESGEEWERKYRGRYITLGGVHTVHAEDREETKPASHNIGMYRAQLFGKKMLAMHWHVHHDGARHWRSWKKLGKPMPVAIALGGESVLPYAATAPLPPGISELLLAGYLNGRGIEMVRSVSVPLWVPGNAEIIIEGYVSAQAGEIGWDPRAGGKLGPGAVFEGPFGDHTGFYSMPDRYPIFTVTAVTHRRNAIYPTTVVGLPPQEDYFLGKATERVFLPLLKTVVHDIEDYDLPLFGAFHNCAFVQIKKAYALQGRRVMHAVWGAGQMSWTKSIFVVDGDVDVHDATAVLRAAARWCEARRDIECVRGPVDILDHAAARLGAAMKIGFDCTRKIAGEDVDGKSATENILSAAEVELECRNAVGAARGIEGVVDAVCPAELEGGWLFVKMRKSEGGQGWRVVEELGRRLEGRGARFAAVFSEGVDITSVDEAMFHWCANTDAARDMQIVGGERSRALFDATVKMKGDERKGQGVRDWPPVLGF